MRIWFTNYAFEETLAKETRSFFCAGKIVVFFASNKAWISKSSFARVRIGKYSSILGMVVEKKEETVDAGRREDEMSRVDDWDSDDETSTESSIWQRRHCVHFLLIMNFKCEICASALIRICVCTSNSEYKCRHFDNPFRYFLSAADRSFAPVDFISLYLPVASRLN